MNVKMVFGSSPSLHHLRHRSHEPQMNQPIWDGAARKHSAQSLSSLSTSNSSHPSLTMEITPLDVDNPKQSQDSHPPFLPSLLTSHRSTPSTPAEESHYRKRLHGVLSPGTALDWKGMSFTVLGQANSSEDHADSLISPEQSDSSTFGFPSVNTGEPRRMSISITPPSSPSLNATTPVVSPSMSYTSLRGDASGTRRMMLKRKNSNFLRASISSTNARSGESGTRPNV